MHRYATTTSEARELISELEFVWDQIKSNSRPSSGSTPALLSDSRNLQQPQLPQLEGLRPPNSDDKRLKVLGPISDNDGNGDRQELEQIYDRRDSFDLAIEDGLPLGWNAHDEGWKRRVEQALVKITTELAALRELTEANHVRTQRRQSSYLVWLLWPFTMLAKHIFVDAVLLGLIMIWIKRRRRVETTQRLHVTATWIQKQVENFKNSIRVFARYAT